MIYFFICLLQTLVHKFSISANELLMNDIQDLLKMKVGKLYMRLTADNLLLPFYFKMMFNNKTETVVPGMNTEQ